MYGKDKERFIEGFAKTAHEALPRKLGANKLINRIEDQEDNHSPPILLLPRLSLFGCPPTKPGNVSLRLCLPRTGNLRRIVRSSAAVYQSSFLFPREDGKQNSQDERL